MDAAQLELPIIISVLTAVFLFVFVRPTYIRARGRRELAAMSDFGLRFTPGDGFMYIGTLTADVDGYRVDIKPDEQERIEIRLRTYTTIQLSLGSGRWGPGRDFKHVDARIDEALEKSGSHDPRAVDALRSFLREHARTLACFALVGDRIMCSPRQGTTRDFNWIRPDEVRRLVPPLLRLAHALDGDLGYDPASVATETEAGYRTAPAATAGEAAGAVLAGFDETMRVTAARLGARLVKAELGLACEGTRAGRTFRVSSLIPEVGPVVIEISPTRIPAPELGPAQERLDALVRDQPVKMCELVNDRAWVQFEIPPAEDRHREHRPPRRGRLERARRRGARRRWLKPPSSADSDVGPNRLALGGGVRTRTV